MRHNRLRYCNRRRLSRRVTLRCSRTCREGSVLFVAPSCTPQRIADTERQYVRIAISEYEAEAAGLRQQRAEREAELAATAAEIAKLTETLPFLEQQMAARRKLTEEGHFSRLKLLEFEQLRVEHVRNIDVQQANAANSRAAMRNIDAKLKRLRESFGKRAVTDLAEANDKAGLESEELRKSERRREFQQIRSPVDGFVQQMTVTTVVE